jgi:hypothetical protein
MKRFLDTELGKWLKTLLEIALIAAVLIGIVSAVRGIAKADTITEEVWVLCEPNGTVNLRSKPGGRVFGGSTCGAKMWTDNSQRDGFLHVLELNAEEETGWISARYIVYDEPHPVDAVMVITSDGRVAVRKWIGGKIIKWLQNGDLVTVHWMSSSWAVTEYGYIRSEYLEAVMNGY